MTPPPLAAIERLHAGRLPIRTGLAAGSAGDRGRRAVRLRPDRCLRPGGHPVDHPRRDHRPGGVGHRNRLHLGTGELDARTAASGDGPDCSGLGLKCWEVPKTLYYQEENGENATISPRYTSYSLLQLPGPLGRAEQPLSPRSMGDILAKNNGDLRSRDHLCRRRRLELAHHLRGPGHRAQDPEDQPLSRKRVQAHTPGVDEHDSGIVLDNPTAKSIGGTDIGGNWTRSTGVAGYYGDDYQVHVPTTDTAWARWTPRLPSTGYYEIFMRWTSATDRSSGSTVTVNTPAGPVQAVHQPAESTGPAGSRSGQYSFRAGYSPATGGITLSTRPGPTATWSPTR